MHLKKFTQKDRFGNMLSYEFEANVPEMNEIPPAFQPGPKGTDKYPAWLTAGENVINAEASRIPGVQPMLDKLNEIGRDIQDKQGGPIPTYASSGSDGKMYSIPNPNISEGTILDKFEEYQNRIANPSLGMDYDSFKNAFLKTFAIRFNEGGRVPTYADQGIKITPEIIDAVMMTESGGDPNKISEAGAAGPYQITEATALNPGYGVKPISLADRFDPEISRKFAGEYLQGIANKNPNFNLDQVLQSYHSGVGNVLKSIGGVEELGPRGKEYPDKVKSAIKEVPMMTFDMTPTKSGMMSAMASTGAKDKKDDKIFPDSFYDRSGNFSLFGTTYDDAQERRKKNIELYGPDVKLDSLGYVVSVNPNRIDSNIPKELADRIANDENYTKEMYDRDMEAFKNANKQNDAYNKDQIKIKENIKIEEENKINAEVNKIDKQIELYKNDSNIVKSLTEKKNKLLSEKPTVKALTNAAEILDSMKDKVDPAVSNDLDKRKPSDVEKEGAKQPETLQDKMTRWFSNMFKDMFSGEELARLSLMYLGSRAFGYNHSASLQYATKQYIKRVDAQSAARQKFVTNKDNLKNYTKRSLMKYRYSGDLNDLERIGTGILDAGTGSRVWVRGYGPMEKIKIGKSQYRLVDRGGNQYTIDSLKGRIFTYDDDQMDIEKITDKYMKSLKATELTFNNNKEGDELIRAPQPLLAAEAADLLYKDMIKFGVDPKDRSNMNKFMERAIELYYKDFRKHLDNKGEEGFDKPQSLETYYNMVKMPLETDKIISFNDLNDSGTGENKNKKLNTENFAVINEMIKQSSTDAADYRQEWKLLKEIWTKADPKLKESFNSGAPEDKGFSGFGWWAINFLRDEPAALALYKPRKK